MAKRNKITVIITIVAVLALVGLVIFGSIRSGRASLENKANSEAPVMDFSQDTVNNNSENAGSDNDASSQENTVKWQDGWVRYNGEIYQYKKDIMTFLLMGTDQHGTNNAKSGSLDGGQADVQTLLVLDSTTKRIELISINRNTMVDVDVYDADGNVLRTTKAQIAVQHGVGNGKEESCEYQVKAVSRFLYQLPIHGYVSMNLEGIVPLGNAIGGVDVTLPNDFQMGGKNYKAGDTIHVEGKNVELFVRERDHELGGADRRLERQRVYMKALISQMISKIKANPTFVTTLYSTISKYLTTDITSNEMLYLATEAASYRYDGSSMHNIQGETVQGELFDEFYADEEALRKLIIDIYYEKVEN